VDCGGSELGAMVLMLLNLGTTGVVSKMGERGGGIGGVKGKVGILGFCDRAFHSWIFACTRGLNTFALGVGFVKGLKAPEISITCVCWCSR
jgi:hypothetical protein